MHATPWTDICRNANESNACSAQLLFDYYVHCIDRRLLSSASHMALAALATDMCVHNSKFFSRFLPGRTLAKLYPRQTNDQQQHKLRHFHSIGVERCSLATRPWSFTKTDIVKYGNKRMNKICIRVNWSQILPKLFSKKKNGVADVAFGFFFVSLTDNSRWFCVCVSFSLAWSSRWKYGKWHFDSIFVVSVLFF